MKTDRDILKEMFSEKLKLNIHEENECFTIVDIYGCMEQKEVHIHIQFSFNEDGSIKSLKGFNVEHM